jgi:hypothetical protein
MLMFYILQNLHSALRSLLSCTLTYIFFVGQKNRYTLYSITEGYLAVVTNTQYYKLY